MGPLIPLFWTSGDVSSGFQSHSGQPYSHLAEAYVNIYILVPTTIFFFKSRKKKEDNNYPSDKDLIL